VRAKNFVEARKRKEKEETHGRVSLFVGADLIIHSGRTFENEKEEFKWLGEWDIPKFFSPLSLSRRANMQLRERTCRIDSPRLVYKLFCEWHFANCRALSCLFANPRRRNTNASCFIARYFQIGRFEEGANFRRSRQ